MIPSSLVNLSGLLNDAKCFAFMRQHYWPGSVCCTDCNGEAVISDGYDDTQLHPHCNPCAAGAGGSDAPVRDARRGMNRFDQTGAEVMP